jgi:hypothetical protein
MDETGSVEKREDVNLQLLIKVSNRIKRRKDFLTTMLVASGGCRGHIVKKKKSGTPRRKASERMGEQTD